MIVTYSMPECPVTPEIRRFAERFGLEFFWKNAESKQFQKELSNMGQCVVPLTVVGDDMVVGYDAKKLEKLIRRNKLI